MVKDRRKPGARPYVRKVCKRWTAAQRAAFLDHLAATCSVTAACSALDVWSSSAYYVRRTDPAFAEAWRVALLTGYDRLEGMLLAKAGAATGAAEAAAEAGTLDADLALRLLALHDSRMKAQAAGTAKPQNRVRRATPEETDAAILRQLAALDRRIKAKRGA